MTHPFDFLLSHTTGTESAPLARPPLPPTLVPLAPAPAPSRKELARRYMLSFVAPELKEKVRDKLLVPEQTLSMHSLFRQNAQLKRVHQRLVTETMGFLG